MTHADTRLSGLEMRGPFASLAAGSAVTPYHASLLQRAARTGAECSPAGGQHQGAEAAERGHIGAGVFRHRIGETVDGSDSRVLGALV